MRLSFAASALVVATALAKPVDKHIDSRAPEGEVPGKVECTNGDTTSADGVQKTIFDPVHPVEWLDITLQLKDALPEDMDVREGLPEGENKWASYLWKYINKGKGDSPLSGCFHPGGTCNIGGDCPYYPFPAAYWAFQAVSKLHSKISIINDKLQWGAILQGLGIDQMQEDFGLPDTDEKWPKWVAAAMGAASGAAGLVGGPAGSMLGMASAAFGAIPDNEDPEKNGAEVKKVLQNIISSAHTQVENILANAVGEGDASKLPVPDAPSYFTNTAKFFSDPNILVDESEAEFVKGYDQFLVHVNRKLVDMTMKKSYYLLFGDRTIEKEEDCKGPGYMWRKALNDVPHCWYLIYNTNKYGTCKNNEPRTCPGAGWERISEEFFKKMQAPVKDGGYDIDLADYYERVIDCSVNGNGKWNPDDKAEGGQLPRCYYDMYCRTGPEFGIIVDTGIWNQREDGSFDTNVKKE